MVRRDHRVSARHLEAQGYLPHVVSTSLEDAYPPVILDQSLVDRIPESVRIDRLAHPNRLKQLLGLRDRVRGMIGRKNNNSSREKPEIDSAKAQNGGQTASMFTRVKDAILNRVFLFPDHQKPWEV